jgi:hypothetical protein
VRNLPCGGGLTQKGLAKNGEPLTTQFVAIQSVEFAAGPSGTLQETRNLIDRSSCGAHE